MSSFFGSNEKKPLIQKSLTFNSSNGLSYVQNNRIVIEIPADSCPYFDPSTSYLKMNVQIDLNSSDKNYLLQLDPYLGAGILCRDIIIRNLQGVLLEELVGVDTMLNVMEQYSANENNQRKAGLTSGQVMHNPNQRTWAADETIVEKSRETNSEFNPWFVKDATGNATFCVVPICLKLPSGIFNSKRIWPNQLMGGLRIEIVLEEDRKCLKCLRNATPAALDGAGDPLAADRIFLPVLDHEDGAAQAAGWANASKQTKFTLSWKNNMVSAETVPFCVGESLSVFDGVGAQALGDIASINWVTISLAPSVYQAEIELAAAYTSTAVIPAGSVVYSTGFTGRGAGHDPFITVSDVSMVVEQIFPEPSYISMMEKAMRESGGLVYDCHCWNNYRHAVGASDVVATIQMNLLNRMAKAIVVVPTILNSESLANNVVNYGGSRNGISAEADGCQNFQWFYNEKFQPDRPVEMDKISAGGDTFNGQYLAEIEKAVMFWGVPAARTYRNINTNKIMARALALNNQVVNLTTGDFQLIANYTAPSESKLLNCWIASVRRFKVTSQGVVVTL